MTKNNLKTEIPAVNLLSIKSKLDVRLEYAYLIRSCGLGLFFGVLLGVLLSCILESTISSLAIDLDKLSSEAPYLCAVAVGGFVLGLIGQLKTETLSVYIARLLVLSSNSYLTVDQLTQLKLNSNLLSYLTAVALNGKNLSASQAESVVFSTIPCEATYEK